MNTKLCVSKLDGKGGKLFFLWKPQIFFFFKFHICIWKDGETHWIKQATGLHEEKKKKKTIGQNRKNNFQEPVLM